MIDFMDLTTGSDDLFHMNHELHSPVIQITLDYCWPQAESVTEHEMFWFPFSP